MTRAYLSLYAYIALGVCVSPNALAIKIPSYAYTDSLGIFSLITHGLFFLALGLFGLLPLPELCVYQVIVLAAFGCILFARHLIFGCLIPLAVLPAGDYVIFIMLILLGAGICFLSLNIKFRHLFGSIGAGYILAYEVILVFAVSSYSIVLILLVVSMGAILLVSKASDFILNCVVRAALVPFCFLLFINCIFINAFLQLHYIDSYRVVTLPIAVCLALGTVLCFGVVFFQKQIKEKVEELADKSGISGSEDKVETVKDNEELEASV